MSNKKDKYKINYSTYISGGRAMGNSGSAIGGGLKSAFSRVKSTSNKENTSSKKSSSGGVSGLIKSSVGSTVTSNKSSNSYDSSSKSNNNLDYNVKKYMGQRGGTFGDKSYTKIGDDFYLKANPYSGIDMKKNNKPKLLKENQYNISEENREKINKGKIESYIKGINPYSAPPKNIRDAKAKESVESLMNSIQKKKNTVFKNQSEDNERGITDQGISQVTSNIKPYGINQRSAVNTKNNSLYQAYPGYGSRRTSEDIQRINDNANNFVKQRDEKAVLRKQILDKKKASKESISKTVNDVMTNNYKSYNEANNVGINTGYPAYGSRVTSSDIQRINADSQSFVDRNKADFLAGQAIKAQEEAAKEAAKAKKANAKPVDNLSDVANYYYVQNGNFDKDKFNQQMTDYKSYLTEKENLKKQNKTKEAEELEKQNEANVNDLLYSNNSVPGQPTSGNFTKEHLGKAVPEYKDIETKENEAKEMEKECSEDPNREIYIEKGESIESNNTNAGFMYDTNPMKAYEDDSWYLNREIEKDTRYKKNYDYMTQEEKDTANYILGKYSAKAQAKYLENIAYRMELRERDEKYNNMKNVGPLQLMYYGLTNGIGEKWHDIVQGMSLAGGNENIIPDSGRSMAIEKKRSELTGVDKYLFEGPEWVGNNIITALASIFSPVVGIPLDATADYGSTYKKSMNGEYNIDEKGNTEIGEKNATKNMLHGLLLNLLFNQLSDVKSDDTYLKKLKDYIKTLPYYVILKDTLDKNDK